MANILIIEDSPTDAHVYSKVLRAEGHTVRIATNGEDGIQMAVEHQPDLILMDIVMPGVNGFQATRELRKAQPTANIPVVMLSTKDQETDRIWGMRQGAFEYLIKPVKKPALIKCVDAALASTIS